jgi:hypothetical protein
MFHDQNLPPQSAPAIAFLLRKIMFLACISAVPAYHLTYEKILLLHVLPPRVVLPFARAPFSMHVVLTVF